MQNELKGGYVRTVSAVWRLGRNFRVPCGVLMELMRLIQTVVAVICLSVAARACTIFVLTDGTRSLFCNNEDYSNAKTRLWFIPAGQGYYGCAYLG
ncbi:MAG TPA: hypothetical protein VK633_14725, partial [Verrucomicrobiae bacterium]|nr:hypothetical protein [Verrucomicrobiae bacterium]